MDLHATIRNRILELCGIRNITVNKLADISGVSPFTLKNILYKRCKDPQVGTIKKLCDGLEITLGEFFATPEFDTLEQEIK